MKDSSRLYSLIAQLDSDKVMERLDAAYKLGLTSDKRATPRLITVLLNHEESPMVRGQAAESLSLSRRKAIKPLVKCSADASAEVRFWCVFSLGHFVRRRKMPLIVARALEERLGDAECPDNRGNWWSVGLEALAMLRGYRRRRFPAEQKFKQTILAVMRDPLTHVDKWRWADCYWHDAIPGSAAEGRALYESALRKIMEAGFEPARFGQKEPGNP